MFFPIRGAEVMQNYHKDHKTAHENPGNFYESFQTGKLRWWYVWEYEPKDTMLSSSTQQKH